MTTSSLYYKFPKEYDSERILKLVNIKWRSYEKYVAVYFLTHGV